MTKINYYSFRNSGEQKVLVSTLFEDINFCVYDLRIPINPLFYISSMRLIKLGN